MFAQIIIITTFGTFKSVLYEVDENSYDKLCAASCDYYRTGFEMKLEEGGFLIIPPEVINKSILRIDKIK